MISVMSTLAACPVRSGPTTAITAVLTSSHLDGLRRPRHGGGMVAPDELDTTLTLRTAVARFEQLRARDALAGSATDPDGDGQDLRLPGARCWSCSPSAR